MYVYDKRQRLQRHYAGGGIFDTIRNVGSGLVNNLLNNLPFELHYPGHNFLGTSTKLNKRLNDDMTPKESSKPVD